MRWWWWWDGSDLGYGWWWDMSSGGPQPHIPLPRYRAEVKHIKVMTAEGLYRLNEKKAFRGLVVSVGHIPHPPTPTPLPGGGRMGPGARGDPHHRVARRIWWSSTSATRSRIASRLLTRPCWCPSRSPRAGPAHDPRVGCGVRGGGGPPRCLGGRGEVPPWCVVGEQRQWGDPRSGMGVVALGWVGCGVRGGWRWWGWVGCGEDPHGGGRWGGCHEGGMDAVGSSTVDGGGGVPHHGVDVMRVGWTRWGPTSWGGGGDGIPRGIIGVGRDTFVGWRWDGSVGVPHCG